ncbi:hypothetical protein GIB67_005582 [Kingdonia uniflora]|uniref:Uncharacterized protein n=1 Tax=Kingdonia uniflora TaxID=39325 RepID=A0A7J7LA26_9MAGN|nr:hypothetical protein GIB67_005582 [Kingdonia uniflora]
MEDPLCEWIAEDDDEPLLPTHEEWPEELERELSAKDPEVNEQRRYSTSIIDTDFPENWSQAPMYQTPMESLLRRILISISTKSIWSMTNLQTTLKLISISSIPFTSECNVAFQSNHFSFDVYVIFNAWCNVLFCRCGVVTSAHGNNYHYGDNVESGQFGFTAAEPGDYLTCSSQMIRSPR